ncbi:MAG: 1-deoxy-D-xylulose-5-phosphate reductoisomerase [Acidobacteriia bacterium]|nr:1-deoxy-D-xylulose-5-phosphate reductoisomerase [Terriglobia bacterium]
MKRIVVLGSTGSIGTRALDVVASFPEAFRVIALGAGRNVDRVEEQVRRFEPKLVAVADDAAAAELVRRIGDRCAVVRGPDGLVEAALHPEADLVVSALVGAAGLRSTWAAVDAGRDVALANKESLVVAGEFLTARARATGASILPVDSEHNAVHQCLRGEDPREVRRLWLTGSGGPFRTRPLESLANVTPAEALRHPTWKMGPKITVDSATLMNKGLEVIEAHWLFGLPAERIRVVIHPKSVVHSMVEFVDGSFKAQLGVTDMRHPIQYALTWPERWRTSLPPFDPVSAGPLEFEAPDPERFPCLALAYRALERGGAAPAVLNAANEVAVSAFLEGRAGFLDLPAIVRQALDRHENEPASSLEDLVAADAKARETAALLLPLRARS